MEVSMLFSELLAPETELLDGRKRKGTTAIKPVYLDLISATSVRFLNPGQITALGRNQEETIGEDQIDPCSQSHSRKATRQCIPRKSLKASTLMLSAPRI